jgi:signal transduction histidine kinase
LLRDEPDPERRRKLAVIHAQAMRAHEMIADLMLFAQPPPLRAATIDAVELVDQVLQELAPDAAEQGTALVHVTPSGPLWLTADHDHLAVAVKAVCRNALEALSLAGRIEVAVQTAVPPVRDVAGGEWIAIAVHDTGRGIPPEVRRHLFDPYFSGREAGRGLGLGLSKCWRIITDHGGRIDVDSGPDRGTTITLRLPKTGPASRSGGGP